MKTTIKRLAGNEKGQALLLAVILLLVGGLIAAPLLAHMGTGILTGEVYETRTAELYAADAGVEDAISKIQHSLDEVKALYCGAGNHTWTYPQDGDPPITVNGKGVEVTMAYVNNKTFSVLSTATGGGSSTSVEAYLDLEFFDLLSGALVSMSGITFKSETHPCNVTGNVYYVTEITGDYEHNIDPVQVLANVFPTQQQNDAFAQQFKDAALLGGTNGTMTISSDRTLGPLYIAGNLAIGTGVTVTLAGTIYVEGTIDVAKDAAITGSGSIVAVGDIRLAKLPDYGVEGDTVIMSRTGNIVFKKEATINAFVYAPNGDFEIDKDITVLGGLIGHSILVKKEGSFTYLSKASSFGFPILVPNGAEIKTYVISQH